MWFGVLRACTIYLAVNFMAPWDWSRYVLVGLDTHGYKKKKKKKKIMCGGCEVAYKKL